MCRRVFKLYFLLVVLFLFLSCTLSFSQVEITVQPGDTLWDLAERYQTNIEDIKAVNSLTSDSLRAGTKLLLPSNSNIKPETYVVKQGDTLFDISVAFHIPLDQLIAINNIDGTTIKPDQVLLLSTDTAPAPLIIEVQAGDTLWDIAREHQTSTDTIRSVNNLASDSIRPGQKLTIQGRYASQNAADQGGAATSVSVKVQAGDTLWEIAKKYNISITALMSANELDSQTIKAGQTLRIVPGNQVVKASPKPSPIPTLGANMVWPLDGQITSRYGYRRLRIGGSNFHTGLDIDGETGDPIYAAISGVVSFAGWRSGYGNLVILSSGENDYYYAHASEILVTEGEVVGTGQAIALVGSTGRSTGSHLHFEIRVNGETIDPLGVLDQQASR